MLPQTFGSESFFSALVGELSTATRASPPLDTAVYSRELTSLTRGPIGDKSTNFWLSQRWAFLTVTTVSYRMDVDDVPLVDIGRQQSFGTGDVRSCSIALVGSTAMGYMGSPRPHDSSCDPPKGLLGGKLRKRRPQDRNSEFLRGGGRGGGTL